MSPITANWRSLNTWLLEHKAQLSLSVRATVAAVLSLVLSNLLHLPLPLWTVLTAIILTQVSFGRSAKATVDYLAGTVAGAIYAGAVAALVPHASEIALTGVLVIVVAPLALVGAIKPSFSVSTFTGVLVIFVPVITQLTPMESAFYRVVEVGAWRRYCISSVGAGIADPCTFSRIEAAARTVDLMARSLPELFAGFVQNRDTTALERIHENIGDAITQLNAITEEARHERIGPFHPEPDLGPLMRKLVRLRYDLIMIAQAASVPLPQNFQQRLGPPLTRVAATAPIICAETQRHWEQAARRQSLVRSTQTSTAAPRIWRRFGVRGLASACPSTRWRLSLPLEFALEQMRRNFHDLEPSDKLRATNNCSRPRQSSSPVSASCLFLSQCSSFNGGGLKMRLDGGGKALKEVRTAVTTPVDERRRRAINATPHSA